MRLQSMTASDKRVDPHTFTYLQRYVHEHSWQAHMFWCVHKCVWGSVKGQQLGCSLPTSLCVLLQVTAPASNLILILYPCVCTCQVLDMSQTPGLETPQYTVLKAAKDYEIRRYEPFVVVEAPMGAGASEPEPHTPAAWLSSSTPPTRGKGGGTASRMSRRLSTGRHSACCVQQTGCAPGSQ